MGFDRAILADIYSPSCIFMVVPASPADNEIDVERIFGVNFAQPLHEFFRRTSRTISLPNRVPTQYFLFAKVEEGVDDIYLALLCYELNYNIRQMNATYNDVGQVYQMMLRSFDGYVEKNFTLGMTCADGRQQETYLKSPVSTILGCIFPLRTETTNDSTTRILDAISRVESLLTKKADSVAGEDVKKSSPACRPAEKEKVAAVPKGLAEVQELLRFDIITPSVEKLLLDVDCTKIFLHLFKPEAVPDRAEKIVRLALKTFFTRRVLAHMIWGSNPSYVSPTAWVKFKCPRGFVNFFEDVLFPSMPTVRARVTASRNALFFSERKMFYSNLRQLYDSAREAEEAVYREKVAFFNMNRQLFPKDVVVPTLEEYMKTTEAVNGLDEWLNTSKLTNRPKSDAAIPDYEKHTGVKLDEATLAKVMRIVRGEGSDNSVEAAKKVVNENGIGSGEEGSCSLKRCAAEMVENGSEKVARVTGEDTFNNNVVERSQKVEGADTKEEGIKYENGDCFFNLTSF